MSIRGMIILPLFLFISFSAASQNQKIFIPVKPRIKIEAGCVTSPVKIDGRLEKAWFEIAPAKRFVQIEPRQGEKATFQTEVYILFDHDFLYIGAICYDSALTRKKLRVKELTRDFNYKESDAFGVVIDQFMDLRNAIAFITNPYGCQLDQIVTDDRLIDTNWNTKWEVRTKQNSFGWSLEMAIPWTSLRYSPGTTTFGINFFRIARRANELSAWSPFPRAYSPYRLNYAGLLYGLNPPNPKVNLGLTPYALVLNQDGINEKFGFDIKSSPNPQTIIDASINTDFAQVDVDRQVINLTRFSILFPEKRQFFLESSGLFTLGSDNEVVYPFFSRRIGLTEDGDPVPLRFGIRLVNRKHLSSYGGLAALTTQGDSAISFFTVARYSRNFNKQNRIGIMGINRLDRINDKISNNLTTAADFFFRINNRVHLEGMVSNSYDYASRGISGYSAVSSVSYRSDLLNLVWKETFIDRNYSPKAGFLGISDILGSSLISDLFLRPKWLPGFIRDLEPALYFNFYHAISTGKLQQGSINIWPVYILFQNGSVLSGKWLINWQNLDSSFSPVNDYVIMAGKYFYNRIELSWTTDPSRAIGGRLLYSTGNYFDRNLDTWNGSIRFTPIPYLSMELSLEYNHFGPSGNSDSEIKAYILQPQCILALSPRLRFSTLYQYNSDLNISNLNLRFAWEYKPLSFFYIVYNSNKEIIRDIRVTDNWLILKLSYLHQF